MIRLDPPEQEPLLPVAGDGPPGQPEATSSAPCPWSMAGCQRRSSAAVRGSSTRWLWAASARGRHLSQRAATGSRGRSRRRASRCVDVATGTGAAAFSALRRLAPDRIVYISPRMLIRARCRAAGRGLDGRIEWRAAQAVPLDIDDPSAHVVLCASALPASAAHEPHEPDSGGT